jgi:flagellar biosynthesis chaperone FliJ
LPKAYQRVISRAAKTKQGYLKTVDELDSVKRERKNEIKTAMSEGFTRAEAKAGVDEYIAILEQAISASKFNDEKK